MQMVQIQHPPSHINGPHPGVFNMYSLAYACTNPDTILNCHMIANDIDSITCPPLYGGSTLLFSYRCYSVSIGIGA